MKIIYENTEDDLLEFTKYHYANSETLKNQKRIYTIVFPLILMTMAIILFYLKGEIKYLIYIGIFCISLIYFTHKQFSTGILKTAKKMYGEGNLKGFLCKHTLETSEKSITEITEVNETISHWDGILKIEDSENFAFIYIQANAAHIIPKHRIEEGDFDTFISECKSHLKLIRKAESDNKKM